MGHHSSDDIGVNQFILGHYLSFTNSLLWDIKEGISEKLKEEERRDFCPQRTFIYHL